MDRRFFLNGSLAMGTVALAFAKSGSALAAEPNIGADWQQWRGPNRDAVLSGAEWPNDLNEKSLQKLWGVNLEPSYSGPVVYGERVFVTETRNASDERTICLDRQSGDELWSVAWAGAMNVPFFAASNGSWIRSTPACDGEKLFVGGMRDYLAAIDVVSGKIVWDVDFMQRFKSPLPAFGQVCSPLVVGSTLFIQSGGGVVALDTQTGETIWRSLENTDAMNGSAFSSPVLVELHGRSQLLVQTRTTLCGLEPTTGKTIWTQEIEAFRGMNILTPTVWNDCVFTSTYGGKTQLIAFEDVGSEVWKPRSLWNSKAEGYMSSPVVVDDFAYLHLRNQRFVCIDLKSGDERWRTRPYGKYWSMITNQEKILALDEQGKLFLVKVSPDRFDLLDERKIADEECWAHLALSGDRLFIRHLRGLDVYKWG